MKIYISWNAYFYSFYLFSQLFHKIKFCNISNRSFIYIQLLCLIDIYFMMFKSRYY